MRYVVELAQKYSDIFTPGISVHPYRADALEELDRWAKAGVKYVKWLPNAMGIDPADPAVEPFYEKMKELRLILLSHAALRLLALATKRAANAPDENSQAKVWWKRFTLGFVHGVNERLQASVGDEAITMRSPPAAGVRKARQPPLFFGATLAFVSSGLLLLIS